MTDFTPFDPSRSIPYRIVDLICESGRYLIHDPKKWECTYRLYTLIEHYVTHPVRESLSCAVKKNMAYLRQVMEDLRGSSFYETIELDVLLLSVQMKAVEDKLDAMDQGDSRLQGNNRLQGNSRLQGDNQLQGEEHTTEPKQRMTSRLFMEPMGMRPMMPACPSQHTYFTTSSSIVPDDGSLLPLTVPVTDKMNRIIVYHLPCNISKEILHKELLERFQHYGVVRDVYLPMNKDVNSVHYGTLRGVAFIKYETATQCKRVIRVLSVLGLTIHGKKVTVERALH